MGVKTHHFTHKNSNYLEYGLCPQWMIERFFFYLKGIMVVLPNYNLSGLCRAKWKEHERGRGVFFYPPSIEGLAPLILHSPRGSSPWKVVNWGWGKCHLATHWPKSSKDFVILIRIWYLVGKGGYMVLLALSTNSLRQGCHHLFFLPLAASENIHFRPPLDFWSMNCQLALIAFTLTYSSTSLLLKYFRFG